MKQATSIRWVTWVAITAPLFVLLHAMAATESALLETALDPQAGVVERTRAFTDLRAVATDASVDRLAALLGDRRWSYAARSVLEVMPGPKADRALLAALESPSDPALAAGLVNSLGRRRSESAIPIIAPLMASSEPALADAAVNALGNIGSARAADALTGFQPAAAVRAVWADAVLRAAEALRSSDRARSTDLYRIVVKSGSPAQSAVAAIALARASEDPLPMITTGLKSPDAAQRRAVLASIRAGEFGPGLIEAVAQIFPALSTDVQVQVLSVLQDRGDREAAPLARAALAGSDITVRAAAARLLSVVGDGSDVPALIRLMTGSEEPAPSARLALTRVPGNEAAMLLLERYRGDSGDRAAALEVLVSRGYRALLPELLRPENFTDGAFGRSVANAIVTLGAAGDLERVLSLYCTVRPNDRAMLEPAVRRIAAKDPSADVAATHVIAAIGKLPIAERGSLIAVLAGIGGDRAFAFVAGMLESGSAETRRAALRTFGSWRDSRPSSTMFATARNDPDATVRSVALQSATALFRRSAMDPDGPAAATRRSAAIAGLRQIWELAEQPEARNAVVVALRGLKDPKAIAVAEELEKKDRRAK
jgi:HEAT repeat protein